MTSQEFKEFKEIKQENKKLREALEEIRDQKVLLLSEMVVMLRMYRIADEVLSQTKGDEDK